MGESPKNLWSQIQNHLSTFWSQIRGYLTNVRSQDTRPAGHQNRETQEKRGSWLSICTLFVIIVIVLWGLRELQKAVGSFQSPAVQVLESINIQKLTVYKTSVEVITRATEGEDGNISVQLLTGGLLGRDKRTEILYRGCLDMRYGLDLPELTDKHYQVDADLIKLTLPPPRVIGSPQFVAREDCITDVIRTRSSNWFFSPDTTDIVKYTRIALQEKLPEWMRRYNFDEKVQERTEQVIKDLLESFFPGHKIAITFDASEQETGTS